MKISQFSTPIGKMVAVGNEAGISQLLLSQQDEVPLLNKAWQRDNQFFDVLIQEIEEYLAGERFEFTVQLNPKGTPFQQKCWKALQTIPYGETRSYSEQAKIINNPKAARAVGLANKHNPIPILIPCHRVIGADGRLTGYAYGNNLKRYLLDLEENAKA